MKLEKDKIYHLAVGLGIFAIGCIFSINIAIILVYVAAILKEAVDQWRYKGADWQDILATVLVPTLIYFIL